MLAWKKCCKKHETFVFDGFAGQFFLDLLDSPQTFTSIEIYKCDLSYRKSTRLPKLEESTIFELDTHGLKSGPLC